MSMRPESPFTDETAVQHVPAFVSRQELSNALAPLFELLGTSPMAVYDETGVTFDGRFIRLTIAGPVETTATSRVVTVGSDPRYTERGVEIHVQVVD